MSSACHLRRLRGLSWLLGELWMILDMLYHLLQHWRGRKPEISSLTCLLKVFSVLKMSTKEAKRILLTPDKSFYHILLFHSHKPPTYWKGTSNGAKWTQLWPKRHSQEESLRPLKAGRKNKLNLKSNRVISKWSSSSSKQSKFLGSKPYKTPRACRCPTRGSACISKI